MKKVWLYLLVYLMGFIVCVIALYALKSDFTMMALDIYADQYSWIQTKLGSDRLISITNHDYKHSGEAVFVSGDYISESGEGTYMAAYAVYPFDDQLVRRDMMILADSPSSNMGLSSQGMLFSHRALFTYGEGIEVQKTLGIQALILLESLFLMLLIGLIRFKRNKGAAKSRSGAISK